LFKARSKKSSTNSRSQFSKPSRSTKREDSSTPKKFERKGSSPFRDKERSFDSEKPRSPRSNDGRTKAPFQQSERTESTFKKPFRKSEDGASRERPRSPRSSDSRSRTPFQRSERTESTYKKPFSHGDESSSSERPRSPRSSDSRSRTPFQRSERTESTYKKPFSRGDESTSSERPRSPRSSDSRSRTPFQRSERTESTYKKPFPRDDESSTSERPRSPRSSDSRSRTPFQRSERTESTYKKPFPRDDESSSGERPRSPRSSDSRSRTPFQRSERGSKPFERSSRREDTKLEPLTVRLKSAPVNISKAHSEFVDEENKEKRVYVKSTPGKRYTSRRPTGVKKRGEIKKTPLTSKSKLSVSSMLENAPIRLNKYIADGGVASRRTADELIETGKVTVNGAIVIDLGTKVSKTDLVSVNGEPVSFQKHLTYILLNKPKDVITTVSDELKRKTVFDIVKIHSRLFPVGRLDRNTTGALLLTNDGELAYRLTHPKFEVPREYIVKVDKKITFEDAKKISEGLELEDGLTSPCVIYVDPLDKHRARLEIKEGKNREVRRMFEFLGYDVKSLDRKSYSFLTTKGLDRGQYRHLTRYEIDRLRSILGLEDTLY